MPKLGIKRVTSGVNRTFLNFRPACKLLTNNDLDPPTSLQTDPNRRPPEAEVRGSNPLGRAMNIKDLRESAGPFFWLVHKWCPDSARLFYAIELAHTFKTFALISPCQLCGTTSPPEPISGDEHY